MDQCIKQVFILLFVEIIKSYCFPTVRVPYPTLAGPPKITPVVPPGNILASSSVHLLCSYDIRDLGPYKVGYKVTWYKIMRFLGGKTGKQVLHTNTTDETAVVINFESAEFHLGDTVSRTETHSRLTLTIDFTVLVAVQLLIITSTEQ